MEVSNHELIQHIEEQIDDLQEDIEATLDIILGIRARKGEMTEEAYRKKLHRQLDWIAVFQNDWRKKVEIRNVLVK